MRRGIEAVLQMHATVTQKPCLIGTHVATSVLALTLLIAGCEEPGRGRPSPVDSRLTAIISDLRQAKDTVEGFGHLIKTKIRRNAEGERLYLEAVSSHNRCLTYIGTGLDCGMDNAQLRERLNTADATRMKLTEWYRQYGPPDRRGRPRQKGAAESGPGAAESIGDLPVDFLVGIIGKLLEYDVALKKLEAAERAAQIGRINGELKTCECRQWSDL